MPLVAITTWSRATPSALQRAADELLALPGGVEVGGVDEVDPGIERLPDQRGRAVLVEVVLEEPARLVAEGHRPEAQLGHDEAGLAEAVVAHGNLLFAPALGAPERGLQGRASPWPRTCHL